MSANIQQIVSTVAVPKLPRKEPLTNLTVQQVTQPITPTVAEPKKQQNLLDRGLGLGGQGLHYLGSALDLSGKYLARPTLGAVSQLAASDNIVGQFLRGVGQSHRDLPQYDLGPINVGLNMLDPVGRAIEVIAPKTEEERKAIQAADSFTAAWRANAKNNTFLENLAAEVLADPTTWLTAGTVGSLAKIPAVAKALPTSPRLARALAEAMTTADKLQDIQALPITAPLRGAKKLIGMRGGLDETKTSKVLKEIGESVQAIGAAQHAGALSVEPTTSRIETATGLKPAFNYQELRGTAERQKALNTINLLNTVNNEQETVRQLSSLDDAQRMDIFYNLVPTDRAAEHVIPYLKSVGLLEDDAAGAVQNRIKYDTHSGEEPWRMTLEEFATDNAYYHNYIADENELDDTLAMLSDNSITIPENGWFRERITGTPWIDELVGYSKNGKLLVGGTLDGTHLRVYADRSLDPFNVRHELQQLFPNLTSYDISVNPAGIKGVPQGSSAVDVLPDRHNTGGLRSLDYMFRLAANYTGSSIDVGVNDISDKGYRYIVYIDEHGETKFGFGLLEVNNDEWKLNELWSDVYMSPREKIRAVNALAKHMKNVNVVAASNDLSQDSVLFVHRWLVREAVENGDPVPAHVLAEYPGLRSKAQKMSSFEQTLYRLARTGEADGTGTVLDSSIGKVNMTRPIIKGVEDGPFRTRYMENLEETFRSAGADQAQTNLAVALTDQLVRAMVRRNSAFPSTESIYSFTRIGYEPTATDQLGRRDWNILGQSGPYRIPSMDPNELEDFSAILINLFSAAKPSLTKVQGSPLLVYAHELAHVVEKILPEEDFTRLSQALNITGRKWSAKDSEVFANTLEKYLVNDGFSLQAEELRRLGIDPALQDIYSKVGSFLRDAYNFIKQAGLKLIGRDNVNIGAIENPEVWDWWHNVLLTPEGAQQSGMALERGQELARTSERLLQQNDYYRGGQRSRIGVQSRTNGPSQPWTLDRAIAELKSQGKLRTKADIKKFTASWKTVEGLESNPKILQEDLFDMMVEDYGYRSPGDNEIDNLADELIIPGADETIPSLESSQPTITQTPLPTPTTAPAGGVRVMTTVADRIITRLNLTGPEADAFRAEFNAETTEAGRQRIMREWTDKVRARNIASSAPPASQSTSSASTPTQSGFTHRLISTPTAQPTTPSVTSALPPLPTGTYEYRGELAGRTLADNKTTRKYIKKIEKMLDRGDRAGIEKFLDSDQATKPVRHAIMEHVLANPGLDPNKLVQRKMLARGEYAPPPPPPPSPFGVRPTAQAATRVGEATAAQIEARVAEENIDLIIANVMQGRPSPMADTVARIVKEVAQLNPGSFAMKSLWMNSAYAPLFTRALQSKSEKEARTYLALMFSRMNMHRASQGVLHPMAMKNISRFLPSTQATTDNAVARVRFNNAYHSILSEREMSALERMFQSPAVQKAEETWQKDRQKIAEIFDKYALTRFDDNTTAGDIYDYVENGLITDPTDAKRVKNFLKKYHMTPEALSGLIQNKLIERLAGIERADFHTYTVGDAYVDELRNKFVKERLSDPELDLKGVNSFWGKLGWIPRAWREQALVSPRYHMANWMDMLVRGTIAGVNPLRAYGAQAQAQEWGIDKPPESLFVGRAAQRNLGDVAKFLDRFGMSELMNAEMKPAVGDVPVIGEKVLSPIVRFNRALARASDNTFREWAWTNGAYDYLLQYKPEFDSLIQQLVPGKNGADIRTLLSRTGANHRRHYGINFSPKQVYDTVIQQGGSADAANQLSQAWSTAVDNASQYGVAQAKRIHLDYETTYNIEDKLFLKNWMPFHFFASRNLPWYLEQLAAHPEIVNAWQAYQDISEQDRINMGLPSRYQGYIPLGDGFLAGLFGPAQAYFNPLAALSIFDQTKRLMAPSDFEEEPVPLFSRENVGRQLDKLGNVGLGVAPWVQIPMSMLGFYGPEDEPMPIFRWSQLINTTAGQITGRPMDLTGEGTMRKLQGAVRAVTTEPVQKHTDSIYLDRQIVNRLQDNMMQEIAITLAVAPDVDVESIRKRYITASREGPGNVEWDRAARATNSDEAHRAQAGFINPFPVRTTTKNRIAIQQSQEDFYKLPEALRADKEFRSNARAGLNSAALVQGFQRPGVVDESYSSQQQSSEGGRSDVVTWGGSVWGYDKPQPYNNLVLFRAYQTWITRQPEGNRSPEDFFSEYGIPY